MIGWAPIFGFALGASIAAAAQPAPTAPGVCEAKRWNAPTYRSTEQLPDGRVTFRICLPQAPAVSVTSVDVVPMHFGAGDHGLPLTKDSSGMWSVTTPAPVFPGTYRFNFEVDGARVPDPAVATYVADRTGVSSIFEVQGPDGAFQAYNPDVPHGAVSEIVYWSKSLNMPRRAHVYTPPGYMKGAAR